LATAVAMLGGTVAATADAASAAAQAATRYMVFMESSLRCLSSLLRG
jgi:hypothetical protein